MISQIKNILVKLFILMAVSSAQDILEFKGYPGPGNGKKIVLISGDEEYRSEEVVPMLGKILSVKHGFYCVVLFAIDHTTGEINPDVLNNIPGLHHLDDADLMIFITRFRELPDTQMKHIVDYTNSGKPIIGIRTSTHAFNYVNNTGSPYAKYSFRSGPSAGGWGREVLGETWITHLGEHGVESTRGVIENNISHHPILKGVKNIWGPTDVYTINNINSFGFPTVLVHGQVLTGMDSTSPDKDTSMMPMIWLKKFQGETGNITEVLTSTMGSGEDFLNEGLRRVIINSSYWLTGLKDSIQEKSNVDFVDSYVPSGMSIFGDFKKGLKPLDYKIINTPVINYSQNIDLILIKSTDQTIIFPKSNVYEIEIFDKTGSRIITNHKFQGPKLRIKNLSNGIYFLKIHDSSGSIFYPINIF